MDSQERPKIKEKLYAKVVARAWCDPKFKEDLLKDPAPILRKFGLDIPEGAEVNVVEEEKPSDYLLYFTLPKPPEDLDLDCENIDDANLGDPCCCCCCC